uniref:Uncharacterized protein n=1 Tax=Anopheles dirus TaxID=7168 RepID=A0A182NYL9_9DIPT
MKKGHRWGTHRLLATIHQMRNRDSRGAFVGSAHACIQWET